MNSVTCSLESTGGAVSSEEGELRDLASALDALRIRALSNPSPESKPDAALLGEYARAQKAYLGAKIKMERSRKAAAEAEYARRAAQQAEDERIRREADLAAEALAAAKRARRSRSIWRGRPIFSDTMHFSYTLVALLTLCVVAFLWRVVH